MEYSSKPGSISWIDLTVDNADDLKDFYAKVVGWKPEPVNMGDYNDYNMVNEDGTTQTGICHKKGVNEKIPSQWMIYFNVENLKSSMEACVSSGGEIIDGPKQMPNYGSFCFIKDPSGAVCTLFENLPNKT